MSDDASDRRRAERIPINLEFASMASTYISDLSEYGVFVHTPDPAPMGSTIKLRFTVLLDDPVIVEGTGRVVRLQTEPTTGMGIEFTDLSPEMILRINDVVSRQRPRDSGPPIELVHTASSTATQAHAEESSPTPVRGSVFRPPPMPGSAGARDDDDDSENAKTGLFTSVPSQPYPQADEDTE